MQIGRQGSVYQQETFTILTVTFAGNHKATLNVFSNKGYGHKRLS